MRRASLAGIEITVAPVSTMKRIGTPLICPSARKCPRVSALSTTEAPEDVLRDTCCWPIFSVVRLP